MTSCSTSLAARRRAAPHASRRTFAWGPCVSDSRFAGQGVRTKGLGDRAGMPGRIEYLEWNSKDQTFDRDLYAFRAFHECDLIDAAVLLTRSADLDEVFVKLGPEIDAKTGKVKLKDGKPKMLKAKYGASTTWMGKLLYRLNAGRHGGCPVLALGMKRTLITDWDEYEKSLA